MARINFETQTDRGLLELTAQTVNDMNEHLVKMNGTLSKHETRLTKLEAGIHCEPSMQDKLTEAVTRPGLVAILAALVGGIIYAFGCAIKWW